jgi:hypothetical protein
MPCRVRARVRCCAVRGKRERVRGASLVNIIMMTITRTLLGLYHTRTRY